MLYRFFSSNNDEGIEKMQEYPIRWITNELAVGYAPRSHDHLATIRALGITAIVNLCAECYDLHDTEKNTANPGKSKNPITSVTVVEIVTEGRAGSRPTRTINFFSALLVPRYPASVFLMDASPVVRLFCNKALCLHRCFPGRWGLS